MGREEIGASPQPSQALIDGEDRFRRLIENLQVGVLLQGARSEVLFANRAALAMLGLAAEQILGKTSFDAGSSFVHEDGVPFRGEEHPGPRALATGRPVRNVVMGFERPAAQGRVWLVVNADPERGADGQLKQVITTFTDVTPLKQAEAALRESEARYRQLVEQAEDIIYRTDLNGHFTYVNPKATHVMGYPEADLLGKHFTDLVRADHRERVAAALVAQFQQRVPNTYDEFVALARDGREVWIGQNVQLLLEGTRVLGFQAMARDITSAKRAEAARAVEASRKTDRRRGAAAVPDTAPVVLVVEDNAVNLRVVAAMLQSLGYRVETARDGLEAVEACSQRSFDAVLMDCQMPEMDGFRATAWIRQREGGSHRTPIIALTGSVLPGEREKCLSAGMDDFLAKPVGLRTLDSTLKKWIARAAAPAPPPPGSWASELAADHPLRVLESQGRAAVAAEILDLFLQTTPLRLEGMRDAHAKADLGALPALAHNLKGAALQIGARTLADLCVRLQGTARGGDAAEAARLLEGLDTEYRTLSVALESERQRLASCSGPSSS